MQSIRDVMTDDPVTFEADTPVIEAARRMRDDDIGSVIITKGGKLHGILTDRDIVVRCVAEGHDVKTCPAGDSCSTDLVTLSPDESIDEAIRLMRQRALRRLVLVENERPVGVVSLGDLARHRDRRSALGEISAAPPNH
jgi:CBS domain-containing protein